MLEEKKESHKLRDQTGKAGASSIHCLPLQHTLPPSYSEENFMANMICSVLFCLQLVWTSLFSNNSPSWRWENVQKVCILLALTKKAPSLWCLWSNGLQEQNQTILEETEKYALCIEYPQISSLSHHPPTPPSNKSIKARGNATRHVITKLVKYEQTKPKKCHKTCPIPFGVWILWQHSSLFYVLQSFYNDTLLYSEECSLVLYDAVCRSRADW